MDVAVLTAAALTWTDALAFTVTVMYNVADGVNALARLAVNAITANAAPTMRLRQLFLIILKVGAVHFGLLSALSRRGILADTPPSSSAHVTQDKNLQLTL
jgi:hypothetical protein